MKLIAPCIALFALVPAGAAAQTPDPASAGILSAFYGLDDSRQLRVRTLPLCRGVPGDDGMPVIFSHEVDDDTLDPEDFRITTQSGAVASADCVTLRPANEPGELRTALVIGEYGSAEDQPATVEIVGDVLSLDGELNFRGAQIDVIPLPAGPTLILAERVAREDWSLGGRNDCPAEGLTEIVRAVWVGGITKPGGEEIDAQEMALYRVDLRLADGSVETVTPFAVGDLNDNDNNHELCLDAAGEPLSVFFPAGALTDPNEDLNPDTRIDVSAGQAD